MNLARAAFDLVLISALIALAWQTLASRDLFRAVVLFISFGLLLALAWVRLDAPDVALAEAAIGAGITGALMLAALGRFGPEGRTTRPRRRSLGRHVGAQFLLPVVLTSFAAVLIWMVHGLPPSSGLVQMVVQHLPESGVRHPVTAVLLNFRGYDTLLELGVLLLALMAIWSMIPAAPPGTDDPVPPAQQGLTRTLLPVMVLVCAYLLWRGEHAPGGAFQAGALLAAGLVLVFLSERAFPGMQGGRLTRGVVVVGFAFFLAVAIATFLLTGEPLSYPPETAGILILIIELLAAISIAVILALAVVGGRPGPGHDRGDSGR